MIKALLVGAAEKVPRTHDLEVLASVASPLYPPLASRMMDLAPASAWIARPRYPDLMGGLGHNVAGDVADMLSLIKAFRDVVARCVSQEGR